MAGRRRSVHELLAELLRSAEGDRIRFLDQQIRARDASGTMTILTSESSYLASIGPLITTTDRELRRTCVILGVAPGTDYNFGRGSGYRPRPIPAADGGLLLVDARSGSVSLLVEAYGSVVTLLTSQPITALVSMMTLSQGASVVRAWLQRRSTRLEMNDTQRAFMIITELKGDASKLVDGEAPDQEIEILPRSHEPGLKVQRHVQAVPEDEFPMPETPIATTRSGEIIVSGRRITHIRMYPNGTQDIIQVEG